jgi:DNA-binding transcriptional LysR family regulator
MTLFKDIELFVLVAEKKSFTSVASDLMIPTSTVSYHIAQLEKELGQQLFSRTTRAVELTTSGMLLYQHFSHILDEGRIALEALKNMSKIPSGLLHIKVTLNFGIAVLGPLLHKFHRMYPKIDLRLELVSRSGLGLFGKCDMAIAEGFLPDSSLYCRKVVEIERHLYASPSYLMHTGIVDEPEQLLSHKCICMNYADPEDVWHLTKSDKHVDVPVKGFFSTNGVPLIVQMVSHGVGIGPIGDFLTKELIEQGLLAPVLPEWNLPSTPIYLLTNSKILPARCRVFMDFLSAEFHRKY